MPQHSQTPTVQRVDPGHLDGRELEAMRQLYANDAVEAYQEIVDDDGTKVALSRYFTHKAEGLEAAITDPNQMFWTISLTGDAVGMAGYNIRRRLIHSVYISRASRSRGLGAILIRSVLDDTEDIRQSLPRTVQVASLNVRAMGFYARLGFKLTGNSKDWNIGEASITEVELGI